MWTWARKCGREVTTCRYELVGQAAGCAAKQAYCLGTLMQACAALKDGGEMVSLMLNPAPASWPGLLKPDLNLKLQGLPES